jgi:4-diphosphocytidyl-2-C-methyl-D-erythritol kinase
MGYPAPAKLNLFLHVTGRRPDGYHDLQTVFQIIDLCDSIDIEATEDPAIRRDPAPSDPVLAALDDDADLTVRAARLLQARTGTRHGARLQVHKRIPSGGGLGGGSSDAATVLVVLNRLWRTGLDVDELARLGLALGADVPVFVRGPSAWGEGRGERLVPVTLPPRYYLVVHCGVSVSTAAVFGAPELTRDSPAVTMQDFLRGDVRNDCEPVVRTRFPEVAEALDWLAARAPGTRLTGTGCCLFAPFDELADARRVAAGLPGKWTGFVVRGLAQSPLAGATAAAST